VIPWTLNISSYGRGQGVLKARGINSKLQLFEIETGKVCPPRVTFTLPTDMSFSDFYASDLSDITSSEEDEEFIPSAAKRSSAKKPKCDQLPYTIPNPLRPPRSTSYSVRALYGPSFPPPLSSSCPLLYQNKSSMD
jgi:hypothetical protein